MNLNTYEPTVVFERKGIFGHTKEENLPAVELPKAKIIEAFLADNDIQHIEFCSTNYGFVYSITKKFKQ